MREINWWQVEKFEISRYVSSDRVKFVISLPRCYTHLVIGLGVNRWVALEGVIWSLLPRIWCRIITTVLPQSN